MSNNRGIFDSADSGENRPGSPFAIAAEQPAPASPFAAAPAKVDSPFAVVDDGQGNKTEDPRGKLPERRKAVDSPFQVADPKEGFGFEAPAPPPAPSAFESSPSPFAAPSPQQSSASPFSQESARAAAASAPAQASQPPSFPDWQQPQPQPQQPQSQPQPSSGGDDNRSESASIKQLELRAIFGVAREMTQDEIMQRTRALPGIRHLARVGAEDMAAVDAMKRVLINLGFGQGGLKLYSGSVPVDFIREGNVQLAVQTDGGFAPGVRETLMLVARELGRMG